MKRPHPFEVGPGVGGRQHRSGNSAYLVALAIVLLVGANVPAALAVDVAPSACTAIQKPQLILSNLGDEGRGRLVLRGQLPATALPAGPSEGELRIEDLGSVNGPVFAMATSVNGDSGDCGRFHLDRSRNLRRLPDLGESCSATRQKARLRIAASAAPGNADRFLLRTRGETLGLPLGALRVTVVFGSNDSCSRWTFAREDCSLDEDGKVLTCRPPATESASDCKPTGCSGQLCSEEDVATTCEFRPEFACYRDAICEPQGDGACDWTPTEELTRCLTETSGPPMPPPVPGLPRSSWSDCNADADCIVYPGLDCCGCATGGGPEVAINRDAKTEVDAYRLCPDVACPAEYLCRAGLVAVCQAGRCEIE